jgi:hypothetical protein
VYRTIAGSEADYGSHLKIFADQVQRQFTGETMVALRDRGLTLPERAAENRHETKAKMLKHRTPGVRLGYPLTAKETRRVLNAGVDPDDVEFSACEEKEFVINASLMGNPCGQCGDRKHYRRFKDSPVW